MASLIPMGSFNALLHSAVFFFREQWGGGGANHLEEELCKQNISNACDKMGAKKSYSILKLKG